MKGSTCENRVVKFRTLDLQKKMWVCIVGLGETDECYRSVVIKAWIRCWGRRDLTRERGKLYWKRRKMKSWNIDWGGFCRGRKQFLLICLRTLPLLSHNNHHQWLHKKKEREATFTNNDTMNDIETTQSLNLISSSHFTVTSSC